MTDPTPIQQLLGGFAPKLAELTDDVLFGDVWERPEQLPGHIKRGLDNGLTEPELTELIVHLAFYAGWPRAMSAITIAKTLFEK